MKRTITIILLLICSNASIGQTSSDVEDSCDTFLDFMKSKAELLKYIDNPCPNDSSCKQDILKAKADLEKGRIKFLMPMGLGAFDLRQEKQLSKLCDSLGMIFDYELFSCIAVFGQTSGCYGLYMDKVLALKFGPNFKESLLAKADSLYVGTDPTVYFSYCDSLPKLKNTVKVTTDLWITIDNNLLSKLTKCSYSDYAQVDVGFYIDTLGNASNFFVSQFNTCGESDYHYKNDLTKLAIDYVKSLGMWIPGTILNRKVRTEFNTRVHFK
jgi:hypothetical protein